VNAGPSSSTETPVPTTPVIAPSDRAAHDASQDDLLAQSLRSATLALALGDWALHHDDTFARAALQELTAAVRSVALGGEPSLAAAPWTPIARPLMDVLRRQLLSATAVAADREAYAECHALLLAMERVHDHLCRDDLYRVADQLGGAGALDLLVEVAHDMRSPLGSILFLVDRVRSGQSGDITEPAARQLGLVYSAAFGLSALASDLMELARGNGRLMGGDPVPFSLPELFRRLQGMVGPVAEERGLALVVEPPARELRVGHPAALLRVLLNLSTNACKFTNDGEVCVRATIVTGDAVRFEVQDTGRGVPADVAARLYQTFRPRTGSGAMSGGHAFSSAGLGLAICRKLVSAMGGTLALTSAEGGGSRFAFTLTLPPTVSH
jgi:signal transduction histidine kinase